MKKIILDTTPNGHMKKTIEVSDKKLKKICDTDTNSPKTKNGFNMFVSVDNVLKIGYNHFIALKKVGVIA
jgi:hypothetical protein